MSDRRYTQQQLLLAYCHQASMLNAYEIAAFLGLDHDKARGVNDAYPLVDGIHDEAKRLADRVREQNAKRGAA